MKSLRFTSTLLVALGLNACASGPTTTQRQEAEAGRANLERVMDATCHVGDSAGFGAELMLDSMPVIETTPQPEYFDFTTIVEAPTRPSEDLEHDTARQPAAVLSFAGVTPGMSVFEMKAGAGYFTEILSLTVGEDGEVFMQNPAAFDQYWNGPEPPRLSDGRLKNVVYVESQFDDLKLEDKSVDLVTWFHGPHELWHTPDDAPEHQIDSEAAFAEIARILKPGGAFVVLDHSALPGPPETTAHGKHRIDPAVVMCLAQGAGLLFAGSSDLFANPEDPRDISASDPTIKGMTDQFLLKFEKAK